MSRKKVKGLVSTIILGVCLLLALFFASRLLSVNLREALEQMSQSASNPAGSLENAGEMELIYLLAASIGVLAVTIAAYIIAIMTLTSCAVPLIFSIKNIRAKNKAIKIINIVYTVLFSSGVLLSLTKMLLFYLSVG
jgi:flagellar biosynthesis protein FlhB